MEEFGLSQVTVAGSVALVVIACFGVLSVILNHHWDRYEIDPSNRLTVRKAYYTVAGILLVLMTISFVLVLI